jgi:hypothetical protein
MVKMKTLERTNDVIDVTTMPRDEAIAYLMKAEQVTEDEAVRMLAIEKGEVTHDQKVMIEGQEITFV